MSVPAWWPALVFGIPVLSLSLVVSAVGIARRDARLPCLGAVLAVPSALYLGGHPGMWWAVLALPGLHLAAAVAIRRRHTLLASLLLLPSLASALLLGGLLLRNL